jgi:hypothetical protein
VQEGPARNRVRATAAGAIITAVVNILVVIFAGEQDEETIETLGRKKEKKVKVKAVEVAAAPAKDAAPVPEAAAAAVSTPPVVAQ